MIKVNELRIGNYVYNNENKLSRIKQINAIGTVLLNNLEFYNEDAEWGQHCNEISGIPLTIEILLSCGFDETINNRDSGYRQIGKVVNGHDFMFTIECNCGPEFYFDMVGVELNYLHQLQNLFFALTSTELKVLL